MKHSHPHTLDLLKQVIEKAPVFFPEKRRQRMEATVEQLSNDPAAHVRDIERAIVAFGREIWPYRKAFWAIHDTAGRGREKKYILELVQEKRLREKVKQFFTKGGRYDDLRRGGPLFEKAFTPIEKQKVIAARLTAHTRVVEEIHDLCEGKRKNECTMYLEKYREEQRAIDARIAQFRALIKGAKKTWRDEILDRAHVFEAGWSGLEREITATDVDVAIEYYTSMVKHYNRFFDS